MKQIITALLAAFLALWFASAHAAPGVASGEVSLRTAVIGAKEKPKASQTTARKPASCARPSKRVGANTAPINSASTNGTTPACTAG